MQDKAVVLLDCSRINGCVFAAALPTSLSRESLLLAAKLPIEDGLGVYVHGLLQPLAVYQRIQLVSGMSVCFLPAGLGAPASQDLSDMLLHPDGWNAQASLQCPAWHPGSHFYLLTDGMPATFAVAPGRRASFRQDVEERLRALPGRLTLMVSKPRIVDHMASGYPISGVIVATEQLQRVPYPPARVPERRVVLILDCRRILQGFQWRLLSNQFVGEQQLIDSFSPACPSGYYVAIRGGTPCEGFANVTFRVIGGQLLEVIYAVQTRSTLGASDVPGPGGPPPFGPSDDAGSQQHSRPGTRPPLLRHWCWLRQCAQP